MHGGGAEVSLRMSFRVYEECVRELCEEWPIRKSIEGKMEMEIQVGAMVASKSSGGWASVRECVEGSVWSDFLFDFLMKLVRVTEKLEVGYRA